MFKNVKKNPIFLELFSEQVLAHCVWAPNILGREIYTVHSSSAEFGKIISISQCSGKRYGGPLDNNLIPGPGHKWNKKIIIKT